jgi:hypothetical protein
MLTRAVVAIGGWRFAALTEGAGSFFMQGIVDAAKQITLSNTAFFLQLLNHSNMFVAA